MIRTIAVVLASLLIGYAAILGYVYVFIVIARRIRAKGYRSPMMRLLVGTIASAGGMGGLVAAALLGLELEQLLKLTVAGMLAAIITSWMLAVLLPARATRISGPRQVRFPYRAAGFLLGVMSFLLPVVELGVHGTVQSLRLIGILGLGASYCLNVAARAASPSLQGAMDADPRPPVLYLRSFVREEDPFIDLPSREAARYSHRHQVFWYARGLTLEEYLAAEIRERIGPMVALGNPDDFVAPEGAARTYFAEDAWMEHFRGLADGAAAFVTQVQSSESLSVELAHIRAAGLHQRLFVITRPRPRRVRKQPRWLPRPRRPWEQPYDWREFAANLAGAGFQVESDDPGPAAVVAFDSDARAVVLVRDAASPEAFIRPIARHVAALPPPARPAGAGAAVFLPA